jgi:hypothetical protein
MLWFFLLALILGLIFGWHVGQNMSREQQRSNYAHAKTLREQIPDLPLLAKPLAPRQDGVRAGRLLLCIHGFGQESDG